MAHIRQPWLAPVHARHARGELGARRGHVVRTHQRVPLQRGDLRAHAARRARAAEPLQPLDHRRRDGAEDVVPRQVQHLQPVI